MWSIKYLLTIICAGFLSLQAVHAQSPNSKRFAAIENEKIAYITKEMNLSQAEAQKFFPIYNQYNKEMWEIKSARREGAAAPRGVNSLAAGRRDVISYDSQEVDLKKQYRKRFADVIGQSRASQFFEIEQNFTEILIKRIQK
ncbi:hypothetical protein [Sphingobacterium psychroaquaticum]|uniref:Uncharacterized protein n=1 Tax=Sphingobacterium psychroaquaticum TaxID=561061 RepID=A0A1X7IY81_9SPHI|nr:hypothetical protein [Sphingobacterium psychroaquaticum]QBQ40285.1 hypothetical protein E2P86_03630 [Sphingobacterium psychroaquaticum]SMG20260.1 hypothetical protein SAMN05660862_1219 [Sphingobacterium psychroaquaticum]